MTLAEIQEEAVKRINSAESTIDKFARGLYRDPVEGMRWPAEALHAAAVIDVWSSIRNAKFPLEIKPLAKKCAFESIERTSSPAHDEFAEYRRREWVRLYEFLESIKTKP